MSSGGGGASGKYGTAALQSDLSRRGALATADETAGTNAVAAQQGGASLASNLLNMNFGGTTSGTTTGTQSGSGSGWGVGASAVGSYAGGSGGNPGVWSFK